MLKFTLRNRPSVWKGLVAGLAGGLAAPVVMTQFQNGWQKASEALKAKKNAGAGKSESKSQSQKEGQGQQKEDATMKAAGKVGFATPLPVEFREKELSPPGQ